MFYSQRKNENEFIKANNLFATDIYREITKNSKDNFLMSPLSVEIILSLTQSGARDETAEEMRNVLHLPTSTEKLESEVKALLPTIKNNANYTFYAANKVYVKKNLDIKDSFRQTAVDVYLSEIENIDFTKNREAAATMNRWVEIQTANKISNLISPSALDEYTRIILINALYFKANWKTEFQKFATKKSDFHKTSQNQNTIKADTMYHYKQRFNYYENHELRARFLEMPYKGDDASFIAVLPNAIEGLSALENQIEKVLAPQSFRSELVNVALPKFKMEKTIAFTPILTNLGMIKAFDTYASDFSGIAGVKGDVMISDVLQKVFIDVDEEGVEAAAATYVGGGFGCAGGYTQSVKNFIADHPFLFYIKVKEIIVFVGRLTSP